VKQIRLDKANQFFYTITIINKAELFKYLMMQYAKNKPYKRIVEKLLKNN